MSGGAAIDKKIALEVVGKRAVAILRSEFGLDGSGNLGLAIQSSLLKEDGSR